MSTPITTIANRPAGKPVFDFTIAPGYCRVVLGTVSNDGQNLVMTGWAYQIDEAGVPVLDATTAAPIATTDSQRTVVLSGVLAGTRSLYDGWCKYVPASQTTINATTLPEGWTSGSGAPSTTPAYGSGYYDTAADQPYTYQQGCLNKAAQSFADALDAQIDNASKLAALGL
ncbi:hypothetical protein EAH75_04350 [Rhodanobacter glycinis]|uniref:hypothetical protein n=1 Tax=Rhodanobacter glycinis TaxID=582702 RepID=UPI00112D0D72|nr:hypothetical protein [Rhodanobacter glycinis]TPG50676.1 hypothetical protein EAH75_04350 [Rhodanobacter glycinis]